MRSIRDIDLEEAIQKAEATVLAAEEVNKSDSDRLAQLQALNLSSDEIARDCNRVVRRLDAALTNAGTLPQSVQTAVEAPKKTAASLAATLQELSDSFKIAQHQYSVLRYRNEGDLNQDAAVLYEVQVRKSSVSSEHHRIKSKYFFYGMLVAQAGVTIASLSLAMKHRNVFWSLASLAGLAAVLLGAYVYLYL